MEASFYLSYAVLWGNSGIFRNKGTSLWYFAPNSGLRKFRHSMSIVEACYQHSSRKVDAQSVINWTVVGQLPPSSDAQPLQFIAQIVKLCVQHDFVARVNWRQLILGSGLVVQVVSALLRGSWQDFNWHDASRGLSAIAELLVSIVIVLTLV